MTDFTLYRGDCLEIMPIIAAGSVDMVMCDLPYGTTACKWDTVIPLPELWCEYERVTQDDAAIVLTAAQPFTTALAASNLRAFRYSLVWDKKFAGNFVQAKRMPLRTHEDILVFCPSGKSPRYFPQMTQRDKPIKKGGNKQSAAIPIQQTDAAAAFGATDNTYDEKHPVSILEFSNRTTGDRGIHPTQKPVALMEYLIRTYTNEGETVLDNCMGSGTTGVACMQSGRNFIGIELNEYAQAAALRILKAWGGDTMRTIYATPFHTDTLQPSSPSTDSGFTTVAEVVEAMGPDWLTCSSRAVVYPGVMFSDYEVAL